MSKIFVTGHSGFIGQNLVPLLEQDHVVHKMQSDLLDYSAVTTEIESFSPDIVVHLAARTEVEKSFYEQVSFSEVNYLGSVNLIEAAARLPNLKNFLFASTMEVYGWQPISDEVRRGFIPYEKTAFDEKTTPNPNAPYAVAKYAVEKYLQYMHRSRGFPFTAIRQTNTYGRHDNDFFVTEQIISQMLTNPNEVNLGYGNPYRNFIHVSDLLDLWVELINVSDRVNDGMIFTIGPDDPVQIAEWAQLIAWKLGWQGQINWNTKPKRPGEIYWLNSNRNLVSSVTDWRPKINYDRGLDMTIDVWQQKLKY